MQADKKYRTKQESCPPYIESYLYTSLIMEQSRRLRRSPRSKQDKVSRPSTHRKQSISDKFQIGRGKYVHDVEFSQ